MPTGRQVETRLSSTCQLLVKPNWGNWGAVASRGGPAMPNVHHVSLPGVGGGPRGCPGAAHGGQFHPLAQAPHSALPVPIPAPTPAATGPQGSARGGARASSRSLCPPSAPEPGPTAGVPPHAKLGAPVGAAKIPQSPFGAFPRETGASGHGAGYCWPPSSPARGTRGAHRPRRSHSGLQTSRVSRIY